jgi:hypothetical protein
MGFAAVMVYFAGIFSWVHLGVSYFPDVLVALMSVLVTIGFMANFKDYWHPTKLRTRNDYILHTFVVVVYGWIWFEVANFAHRYFKGEEHFHANVLKPYHEYIATSAIWFIGIPLAAVVFFVIAMGAERFIDWWRYSDWRDDRLALYPNGTHPLLEETYDNG